MPFIVPGVARFSLNGSYFGRNTANIIDMRIDTTGTTTDRADAVEDQAQILINQWYADLRPRLSDAFTLRNVSWVDLDEADGTTGVATAGSSISLPQAGSLSSNRMAGNVAILVRKATTSARGQRAGRMYIGGITEDQTDTVNGNNLAAAWVTNWTSSLNSFKSNIEQEDALDAFQSNMVVVHITSRDSDGNPATGDATDVSALQVQSLLATQRRRLRR